MLHYSEYSVFQDIREIENKSQEKEYLKVIKDFIKVSKIILSDKNLEVSKKVVPSLLIPQLNEIGIIKTKDDLELLEKITGSVFVELTQTVQCLYENDLLDKGTDVSLNKFMDSYRKEQVFKYLKDDLNPTFVDFFSGAGGLSLGFTQNGFKPLLANDIEDVCTKTYWFNHYDMPRSRVIAGDIKEIVQTVENYVDKADVVIGGPPCQGFSMANRQRLIDDPRNILYKYFVQAIEKIKPKFFVMENVKGMQKVADQVKQDFHSLENVDYEVHYKLLNAKDYSVPQNRERLFYLGVRSDIAVKNNISVEQLFDELKDFSTKSSDYVLEDAIVDLRKLEASTIKNSTELDSEKSGYKIEMKRSFSDRGYLNLINKKKTQVLFNHKARYNNDRDIEIFGRMLPGDKSDSERIADIMPYTNRNHIFKDKYFKLMYDKPCKTITAHMKFDCNMYIHPTQARGLTPREAARIQSYPDDYYFLGAYTKTYMQVGNSVPPLLARAIGTIIKKYV